MKLPRPAFGTTGNPLSASRGDGSVGTLTPAAKVYVTGSAVCKRRNSVIDSASATVCGNESAFHLHCTNAKNQAAANLRARCQEAGGLVFHSGTCSNDGKC